MKTTTKIDWHPIATAPKDRRIMLWIQTPGQATFGRMDDDRHARRPRPCWISDGNWDRKTWMRANQPTHWAEAPEGPQP